MTLHLRKKPLLEDKIVSVLGCILSLLNKGREDVLSGRSSIMNSFQGAELSAMDDKLPPLAIFRSEMKRCCESLHVALENYLTPDYDQGLDVWRKLQRLKNVCYDSGFPRLDGYPCHMLFANWNAVYLSTSKEDLMSKNSEAAFWRAVADAIASGKVELIKIPVEVRTAPSMEQVEKFASLVSDFSKKPIYLHSKEGVWRTSAMVSRWRQYMTRSASQITTQRDVGRRQGPSIIIRGGSLSGQKNGSLTEAMDKDHGSNGVFNEVVSPKDENGQSINRAYNGHASVQDSIPFEMVDNGVGFLENISMEADPLKAQLKGFEKFLVSRTTGVGTIEKADGNDPELGFVEAKGSNGSVRHKNASPKPQSSPTDGDKHLNGGSNTSVGSGLNEFSGEERHFVTENNVSTTVVESLSEHLARTSIKDDNKNNGVVPLASSDDDMCTIEGNMCASATGVVRVQSRRKAEMFLVRTDGFSCAREQVTESSLAFTHPSTQQQMLMWKTTPKTVLLLKKLGKELMEEAKEVASFLYYQEKMNVLVEPDVHDIFARIPGFGFVQTFYSQDTSDLHERVDFVACLGGDGFEDYRQDLRQVIHGNKTLDGVYITLRMRLRCEIFRHGKAVPGKVFDVLNEVVVDRGSNPYLSKIECYEHDRLITKVQGDGVIVATPTGSTAYSTAAGGSMVHPNVPCMLFTPICPHSLSFRPVILPDSARLELKIPEDARSNAWVSFDGKRRQQLSRGDSVRISMSQHPLPTVNKSDQTGDWFHSLIRCLNWNERLDQKAL
ncbi:putative proteinD KINASE [Salix viminalis]|uniref:DSP-PTPase phosphatase fused to NAD+ Kinase domain-containing protein n=1 Tax=Salix viminalis TaxID=40686 RepID=A0A9Q0ZIN2_SALVM|nr:putative proteinD KINASE [Salix viminalis]